MIDLETLIVYARENNCSDIHLTPLLPPMVRKLGEIETTPFVFTENECQQLITGMLSKKQLELLEQGSDVDFCYTSKNGWRQRVNIYTSQGKLVAAIRILNDTIPSLEQLKMPSVVKTLANMPRGLILVTGATGSGKSTTLAAMIDYINYSKHCHIITIEDPVEYLHEHKNSMVHQREVGYDADVKTFDSALRSSLREDPDVILVGEMRDLETIKAAVTAAETGHLVLSTLHTTGAANTIDRIIDVFPAEDKPQIRTQLSGVLKGVISQQLLKTSTNDGRVAAVEILLGTDSVLNLIRENKCHQIGTAMQTGKKDGMQTINAHLASLVLNGTVDYSVAVEKASDIRELDGYIQVR